MALPDALRQVVETLARNEQLDTLADKLAPVAQKLSEPTELKNALSGVWLGHRLHPFLTDVPIGAWLSASVIDVVGGKAGRKAADRLVTLGILAAVPTAAAGLSDWNDTIGRNRRIGTAHAASNSAALVLQICSRRARRHGHRGRATCLSWMALGAIGAGGYLGGHLSYVEGVGVVHDTGAPRLDDWREVPGVDDLSEGRLQQAEVDGGVVAIVRDGDRIFAIADRCNHAGGPLHEGTYENGRVTCPWHGSQFRVADGAVVRAPAVQPQPVYEGQEMNGGIRIRSRR